MAAPTSSRPTRPTPPAGQGNGRKRGKEHNRFFYMLLAAPGIIWLAVLFIVPFYDVISIAAGRLNFLTESPVAVYNPLNWSHANLATKYATG